MAQNIQMIHCRRLRTCRMSCDRGEMSTMVPHAEVSRKRVWQGRVCRSCGCAFIFIVAVVGVLKRAKDIKNEYY